MAVNKESQKKQAEKKGNPPRYKTAQELDLKISEYFENKKPKPITQDIDGKIIAVTDKHGNVVYTKEKPTLSGLAVYLGFADRQSLYDQKERDSEFSCAIKKAYSMIECYHEENLFEPACTGSIFWLKAHGWKDKPDDEAKDDTISRLLLIAEKLTGTNADK
jgi:hypothetical protein